MIYKLIPRGEMGVVSRIVVGDIRTNDDEESVSCYFLNLLSVQSNRYVARKLQLMENTRPGLFHGNCRVPEPIAGVASSQVLSDP